MPARFSRLAPALGVRVPPELTSTDDEAMASLTHPRAQSGITLERAILVALVLHVLFGLAVTWWPGLLAGAEPVTAPLPPLQFHFVDSPDQAEQPPDTDVLSDRDRRAADSSPRDDQSQPRLEGNTPEMLLRQPPAGSAGAPPQPAVAPQPEATPQPRSDQPAETQPDTQPQPTDRAQPAEANTAQPADASARAQPVTPPAPNRPRTLRNELARLESYVQPQVFDNPNGGARQGDNLAQFDTRGYDLGEYLQRVLKTIEGNWRANIPPLIRTGVGGATFVALSIRRQRQPDGTEVAVIVPEQTWTSSQPAYDSAALFALELSSPLPPIPEYYPYDTISGRLGFLYNLDPRDVRFPDQE